MKSFNLAERNNKLVLFGIMLAVILALALLLTGALSNSSHPASPVVETNSAYTDNAAKLMAGNEQLMARIEALQQLDQQYANAVTGKNDPRKFDSLNHLLEEQEALLRSTINNLDQNTADITDAGVKTSFEKMIAGYRSQLDGRKAFKSLRNAVAMQNGDFNADEKAMLDLQNQLLQKDSRIESLENAVALLNKAKINKEPKQDLTAGKEQTELQLKVNDLQTAIASLTSYNTSLKLDNEKLQKSQNESGKKASSSDAASKEKTNLLQQRVDALSAELQLAQVDCNLSRVDALQIISNARQRKQLLSEASGILTGLADSPNEDIRRKVKEKINRLNQVAANSRD